MAFEQPRGVLGKVTIVFARKLKSFNFLPVPKKASKDSRVVSAWEKGLSIQYEALEDKEASERKMMDEGAYKAETVYFKDSTDIKAPEMKKHPETKTSTDESAFTLSLTNSLVQNPKPNLVTLDTANKHQGISQTDTIVGSEDRMSQREEVLSPAISVNLLNTPASSKESLLSESWEQERSWSALALLSPSSSPFTFSQTVSPCSSRSGAFSPSVVRIKYHTLAQASSLVKMPPTSCQTLGCNSRSNSPCPLSSRARHRLPPAHLSLLTAILRKGRLPILSPDLQRPYSPCWPISQVNMSSCSACSAASTVAPMVAKPCGSKEPNHKARSLKLISNPLRLSPVEHDMEGITLPPLLDAPGIQTVRSKTISSLEDTSSLTLSSFLPPEPSLEGQSKQSNKNTLVSTRSSSKSVDVSLRPLHPTCCISENKTLCVDSCNNLRAPCSEYLRELNRILDSSCQEQGQKPRQTFPIMETAESIRVVQMTCDQSSTPDLKPAKDISASPSLKHADNQPPSFMQNERKIFPKQERVLSSSPTFRHCPSPRVAGHTGVVYTPPPPISSVCPSPGPGSYSSTPDCYTSSPFSATPSYLFSPSPSYSLSSSPTPSLRNNTPDSIERKPYKIKSTYKAFAAIPTNKLLLEQQAIDDEVKRNSLDPSDNFAWEDPHSQMYSPAQLRQRSAELYEEIDEVLENVTQTSQSNPVKKLPEKSPTPETQMKSTASPVPRGRETKYAYCHHQTPSPTERTMTKPGVIRRVTAVTKLDDDTAEEHSFHRHQDSF